MPPPENLEQLLAARIYPGMTAAETRLVKAYLRKHGADWDVADVEARLGAGVLLAPHIADEKARADWERRTKARPDLLLRRADRVAILEAKEQLTNEGVWQVLGYRDLYLAEFPTARVECYAACEAATPTAVQLARAQGVTVYRYEFAAPAGSEARETEAT